MGGAGNGEAEGWAAATEESSEGPDRAQVEHEWQAWRAQQAAAQRAVSMTCAEPGPEGRAESEPSGDAQQAGAGRPAVTPAYPTHPASARRPAPTTEAQDAGSVDVTGDKSRMEGAEEGAARTATRPGPAAAPTSHSHTGPRSSLSGRRRLRQAHDADQELAAPAAKRGPAGRAVSHKSGNRP
jgi:hypothetical protein